MNSTARLTEKALTLNASADVDGNALGTSQGVESSVTQTSATPQLPVGKTDAIEQCAPARPALPESSNES
jgi:hypothetical protein